MFNYGRSRRSMMGCLFSSLRLWSSIICAYCTAIVAICLNVFLIFVVAREIKFCFYVLY